MIEKVLPALYLLVQHDDSEVRILFVATADTSIISLVLAEMFGRIKLTRAYVYN